MAATINVVRRIQTSAAAEVEVAADAMALAVWRRIGTVAKRLRWSLKKQSFGNQVLLQPNRDNLQSEMSPAALFT